MKRRLAVAIGVPVAAGLVLAAGWDEVFEKRVAVVVPGRIVRGAWQRPGPLRRVIGREKIRTVVTLTAINRDDPKYMGQARVVAATGVDWMIVPMRGSRATLAQMAEAADLLADRRRQPVFFHCVAGHHRTSLAQAAYRIRHERWSAERAWREVASMPWARPRADEKDRKLIEAFGASEYARPERGSGRTEAYVAGVFEATEPASPPLQPSATEQGGEGEALATGSGDAAGVASPHPRRARASSGCPRPDPPRGPSRDPRAPVRGSPGVMVLGGRKESRDGMGPAGGEAGQACVDGAGAGGPGGARVAAGGG